MWPVQSFQLVWGRMASVTPSFCKVFHILWGSEKAGMRSAFRSLKAVTIRQLWWSMCNHQVTSEMVPAGPHSHPKPQISPGQPNSCGTLPHSLPLSTFIPFMMAFATSFHLKSRYKETFPSLVLKLKPGSSFCSHQTPLYSAIMKMQYFIPEQATCQNK
jgi:hypothetical protein